MKRLFLLFLIGLFPLAVNAIEAYITDAVDNPSRPEFDTRDDSKRKPAEVLSFFGIKKDMKVLDVLADGGYYTELVSYIVGKEGEVYLANKA